MSIPESSTSAGSGVRLFDPHLALESLCDPDLVREAVTAFIEMYPGLRDDTTRAAARRDPVALRLAAHSWKGACAYVGAEATGALASALEIRAADGWVDDAEVQHFVAVVQALNSELEEWCRATVPQESRP